MSKKMNIAKIAIIVLIIVFSTVVGMLSLKPPSVLPADAQQHEFSAERAMEHVYAIAKEPHPIGSPEHARIRAYIVSRLEKLGLSPEVQKATVMKAVRHGWNVKAAIVNNIIVKIPGTGTGRGKAVALTAHYDTVPMTPGASDDTAPVAALIETARALLAGEPLNNDVILIFTDEEEYAQSGVKAFIEQHPWAGRIGLVLNFEAIGRTGPSIMFETGPRSGRVVRGFGHAASYPVAQSWLFDVYKLTPLNTDFTAFSEAGYPGLNFVYMAGGTVYHTLLDNPETIDRRSLQHHGYNALSLIRYFGGKDLSGINTAGGDAVYFSLFRGLLVNYPVRWAIPLSIIVFMVLVWAAFAGFRKKLLTVRGVLLGILAFFASFIAAAGLAYGAWMLIVKLHAEYRAMYFGRVYNASLYLFALVALSVAIAASLHVLFRKKTAASGLIFGALVLWWILALLSSIFLPGFSYLFTWPLFFSLLAFVWVVYRNEAEWDSWPSSIVLSAGVIPGVIIFAPTVNVIFHFATTSLIAIPVFMVALLLGLLIPQIDLITKKRKWLLSGTMLVIAAGFLAAGSLTSGFDEEHPRPNAVAYILDADTGNASWFSPGEEPDAWTSQFFSAEPEHKTAGELFPMKQRDRQSVITGEAPAVRLDAPVVEVKSDRTGGGSRVLWLRLISNRGAPVITLDVKPRALVRAVEIDGRRIENLEESKSGEELWSLTCYAVPPEGIEIKLEVEPSQALQIQVTDQSRELPDIPGMIIRPRPDDMIPMPNFYYATVVVTSIEIH